MFNDVANQNRSQTVDDIFAETDKVSAGQPAPSNAEIDTKRVGLGSEAGEGPAAAGKKGSWFKIAIIAIVVVIVALVGYLVYSRFFQASPNTPTPEDANIQTNSNLTPEIPAPVVQAPVETPVVNPIVEETTTAIPVVATTSVVITTPIDSDNDGLTDDEEATYRTSANLPDSDSDDLTDYEEVKIYNTEPLNPDTDGDGYKDGQEVKGGYNPKGAGRLPGYQVK